LYRSEQGLLLPFTCCGRKTFGIWTCISFNGSYELRVLLPYKLNLAKYGYFYVCLQCAFNEYTKYMSALYGTEFLY
jgi:hypothetical protein